MHPPEAMNSPPQVIEVPPLRDRVGVFADRTDAGRVLARMLAGFRDSNAIVLAIPAGGVPVAAEIARELALPLDVAVVSKITLPWNTEAGYGAVAFDGSVLLNREMLGRLELSQEVVRDGIDRTRRKVAGRVRQLRGDRPFPGNDRSPAILVDDGLASGFTMLCTVAALRNAGVRQIVVAVPTGHGTTAERIAAEVEALYCANLREGGSFAVADAYRVWTDVADDEALALLSAARQQPAHAQ
jgi:predicted phosphoribosyltransferase